MKIVLLVLILLAACNQRPIPEPAPAVFEQTIVVPGRKPKPPPDDVKPTLDEAQQAIDGALNKIYKKEQRHD